MKLKNPRDTPPGGFFYLCPDGRRIESGSNMRALVINVENYYLANGDPIPDDLPQIIEDQICERLPGKFCWKGFGDVVASGIQTVASTVDKVLGTDLTTSAKGCSKCGQRKRRLNRIGNR